MSFNYTELDFMGDYVQNICSIFEKLMPDISQSEKSELLFYLHQSIDRFNSEKEYYENRANEMEDNNDYKEEVSDLEADVEKLENDMKGKDEEIWELQEALDKFNNEDYKTLSEEQELTIIELQAEIKSLKFFNEFEEE